MRHWSLLPTLLAIALAAAPGHAAIPRWDALPALDVVHLAGPHAGSTVCPMCRHGYDAGLLVLVPASLPESEAVVLTERLGHVARGIDDERFRIFVVIEGTPAPALVDLLRSDAPGWHVARGERFPDSLFDGADRIVAYAFAQRRVLARFDPRDTRVAVATHARAAMRFLAATYADAAIDTAPETPKGRLWLAPAQLSNHAVIGSADTARHRNACLASASGLPMPGMLLALRSPGAERVRPSPWVRTDDQGCLALTGSAASGALQAEVFEHDGSAFVAHLDGEPHDPTGRSRLHTSGDPAMTGRERVVGLPCEDCAQVLASASSTFAAQVSLTDIREPGERLVVSGVVRDRAGRAQPGVILFVYQTDASGRYHPDAHARGFPSSIARLRGWMRSDDDGRYRFDTIRPGLYPDRSAPTHVHLHVIEPGRCTYYAGDYLFDDDPVLTPAARAESRMAHAGSGLVEPAREPDGSWSARRDIVLGHNVDGYEACAGSPADLNGTRPASPAR